jgi:hypothetical protein
MRHLLASQFLQSEKILSAAHLTNSGTFPGQATLAEPGKMPAHVRYASKPERLNCLASNMRNGLINRICGEDEA